jgi:hypothetical protein
MAKRCPSASASASASGIAERGPPVIVDASALPAFFDASEPDHDAVSGVIDGADGLAVSPYVVAELDYLAAIGQGERSPVLGAVVARLGALAEELHPGELGARVVH